MESQPDSVHVFVVPDTVSCCDLFTDWERVGGYFDRDLLLPGSCGEEDCPEYADSCISADCVEPGTYYIVIDGYTGAGRVHGFAEVRRGIRVTDSVIDGLRGMCYSTR